MLNSNTLASSSNREVVTGLMVFAKVQKDDIPELCLSFFPHIPVQKDFWRVLLGLDGTGDLQEQHIDNWAKKVVATRSNTARWTVMITQFSGFMLKKKGGEDSVVGMCDGTEGQERPWHVTDMVYIPICVGENSHWVLGALDLPTMEMVVYDSLRSSTMLQRTLVELMKIFAERLKKLLKKIKYRPSKSFSWKYDDRASQQSGRYGDCGVWVCKNMESLAAGEIIPSYGPNEAADAAMLFRLKMAEVFYAHAQIPQ